MRFRILIAVIALALIVPVARAGDIRTVDGKTYHGQIQLLDTGKAMVTNDQNTATLNLAEIADMLLADASKLGGHGLQGEYFLDQEFSQSKGKRIDPVINVRWAGGEEVIKGITADSYSIRWTGLIRPLYSELYTFSTINDDDVRLWINGQMVLESWTGGMGRATGQIALQAGVRYDIKIDYVNRRSTGALELKWSSPSQTEEDVPGKCLYAPMGTAWPAISTAGNGLQAQYTPLPADKHKAVTRVDPAINFTWQGPPDPSFGPKEHFFARWAGSIKPLYTGNYTFYTHCTGGVKLTVNDNLIINDLSSDAALEHTGTVALEAGKTVNIAMDYLNMTPPASAVLQWSSEKQAKGVVPTACLLPNAVASAAAGPLQESELFDIELAPPNQGTVLTDGSVIPAVPDEVDPHGTVVLHWKKEDLSVPARQIAMVFADPAVASPGWTWPGERGAVLHNGDFVEGAIQSFKNGQVRVSSIIFGLKDYQFGELQSVLLHKPVAGDASFLIRCADGSTIAATTLAFKNGSIVVDTQTLGQLTFPAADIFSIKSTKPEK